MKSMLLSLLVIGILVTIAYSKYTGDDQKTDAMASPAAKRFMARCTAINEQLPKPKVYCDCLWRGGVHKMASLMTSVEAGKTATRCASAERSAPRGAR